MAFCSRALVCSNALAMSLESNQLYSVDQPCRLLCKGHATMKTVSLFFLASQQRYKIKTLSITVRLLPANFSSYFDFFLWCALFRFHLTLSYTHFSQPFTPFANSGVYFTSHSPSKETLSNITSTGRFGDHPKLT